MGWPLRPEAKFREFGGSFIYPMGEDMLTLGMVVGLDYRDVELSVHDVLQELKTHPFVRDILEGGERVAWGAKTIPSGGYWALPRKFAVPGMLMCGDNAGMCNVSELKGIHYAMHAGMYAAEAIVDALKKDSVNFEAYDEKVHDSVIEKDLYRSRNMRQPLSRGLVFGGAMGSAMAHNLLAAGDARTVYNRSPERAQAPLPAWEKSEHLKEEEFTRAEVADILIKAYATT